MAQEDSAYLSRHEVLGSIPSTSRSPVLLYRYKEKMAKKNLWNLGGVVKMLNFTLNGFHINKSKISKIAIAPGRSASQLSRYHEQGHQDMEGYGGGVSISQEELVLVKRDSLTHSLNPL